ncbi:MAG: DUF4131 domain-containing protein [Opitutaceae bacterium]|nr:DUF4131 domain-containing protein [Cephaloticoccus sp.]MCP5529240.1 DUF4131 domain-containing protein [Opitutaceae bacterium]
MRTARLGLILLVVLLIALFLWRETGVRLHPAWLGLAIGSALLGWVLLRLVNHWIAPPRSYHIESHVAFTDPVIPMFGRRKFRAEILVREINKGRDHVVNRRKLSLTLRSQDPAQFRRECLELLARAQEEERAAVARAHPQAEVKVVTPAAEALRQLPAIDI